MKRLLPLIATLAFFFFLPSPASAQGYLVPGQNPQSRAICDAGTEQCALEIAQSKAWTIDQLDQDTYLGYYGASGELVYGTMPAGTWIGYDNAGHIYIIGYTDAAGVWRGCGNLTTLTPPPSAPPTVEIPSAPPAQAQAQVQAINITVNNITPPAAPYQMAYPTGGGYSYLPGGSMSIMFYPAPGDTNVNVYGGNSSASVGDITNVNLNSNTNNNTNTNVNQNLNQQTTSVGIGIGVGQ